MKRFIVALMLTLGLVGCTAHVAPDGTTHVTTDGVILVPGPPGHPVPPGKPLPPGHPIPPGHQVPPGHPVPLEPPPPLR